MARGDNRFPRVDRSLAIVPLLPIYGRGQISQHAVLHFVERNVSGRKRKALLRAPIFRERKRECLENKNGTIRIYCYAGRLITEADTTAIDSNIDGVLYACHPSMPFAIVPFVADGQISFQFRRLYEVSLQ